MSFLDDGSDLSIVQGEWDKTRDRVRSGTNELGLSATQFATAISRAFAQATTGGKQFDDVLKSLTLKLSTRIPRMTL